MNLVESLEKATAYLERHNIRSPRLNSELLLCHTLRLERIELYTAFDRELSEAEAGAYRSLLVRRGTGRPLQYITCEAGFRGLTLEVREGVFIPRPETEVLVEKAIEVIGVGGARVLDLGTGCGNIAVSIAAECPRTLLTATDVDPAAVALCRRNAMRHGVVERVRVLEGDLFEALRELQGAIFDVVVSNPPYIPERSRETLEAEVRDFEPHGALFAGEDGLAVTERLIAAAPGCLRPGGWLVLEADESAAEEVAGGLRGDAWEDVECFRDLAGRPRVVRARLGERRAGGR